MAPFDRSHTSSYSSSVVTMAVSRTVFEIKGDIGRKRQFFIPPCIWFARSLEPPRIFVQNFNTNCPSP